MRWEYKTIAFDSVLVGGKIDLDKSTETLNKAGADGWELVSLLETNVHGGGTGKVVLFLKRPLG